MILIPIAILLGLGILIWLWKGPVNTLVKAMKENGSSAFEAYTIILLTTGGLDFAVYLMWQVV